MKSYMLVLTVALFGAMIEAEDAGKPGGEGGSTEKMGMFNMTCLGEPIKKETMWKGFKECIEEMKAAAGDKKEGDGEKKEGCKNGKDWEKLACLQVCVMKKQGWLNADGDYESAAADTMIKEAFPEKAQEPVKKAMDGCAAQIGDKATRMDNNCAGYQKFMKCQMDDVMGKACGNTEAFQKMKEQWAEKMKKKNGKDGSCA